mmetsp:Transcript_26492/g.74489  ORF Transcript_26492/g.74489 Transcript_26492/m.74489 type:complete len:171 (-) Transcript_26492:248-760(-)
MHNPLASTGDPIWLFRRQRSSVGKKLQKLALSQPEKSHMCDICQDAPAYCVCVDERAVLCRDCDLSIHKSNKFTEAHNRFLFPGLKIGLEVCLWHPSLYFFHAIGFLCTSALSHSHTAVLQRLRVPWGPGLGLGPPPQTPQISHLRNIEARISVRLRDRLFRSAFSRGWG